MKAAVTLNPRYNGNSFLIIPGLDETIIRELGAQTYGSMSIADFPELLAYRNIESFVTSAGLTEKLFVLCRLGFRFNFTLKDSKRPALNKSQWQKMMDSDDGGEIAKTMAVTGTFCFGDAEVMRSLALMSTVGNSYVYRMTREFVDVLTRLKLAKDIDAILDFNNNRDALTLFHKLVCEIYGIDNRVYIQHGITELHYLIMVTLFESGGLPMKRKTIFAKPYFNFKQGTMNNALSFLTINKYVDVFKQGKLSTFVLTGKGAAVVGEMARIIVKKII